MTEDLDRQRHKNFLAGLARLKGEKSKAYHGSSADLAAEYNGVDDPQAREALAHIAIAYAERMGGHLFRDRVCESPIEELFWSALVAHAASWTDADVLLSRCEGGRHWGPGALANGPVQLEVCRQHQIGDYRVDFFLTGYDLGPGPEDRGGIFPISSVVVECDGHDFHERTKEQARRDRQRDRDLQRFGFNVFSFTGSEIFADPFRCAAEAFDSAFAPRQPGK